MQACAAARETERRVAISCAPRDRGESQVISVLRARIRFVATGSLVRAVITGAICSTRACSLPIG